MCERLAEYLDALKDDDVNKLKKLLEEGSSLSEYIHSYDTLKEAYFCYKRGWLDCLEWFASA